MANFTDTVRLSPAVPRATAHPGVRLLTDQTNRVSYMGTPVYKRHGLASQTPITFTGDVTIVSIAGTVLVLPAPAISNVLPANMSTILPTDTISFDVTFSTAGERRTLVAVRYADDLSTDLVHDGANFEALYNTSTRNAIVGGWHYVLRKNNGWPSPPQPVIFAFDKAGEEL